MLMIRLTRVGKTKQPEYRFIVSEKARDPWGKALEILGTYNPRSKPVALKLEQERIKYWISKGAQCSETVWNILINEKVVTGEKRKVVKFSTKRKAKLEKEKAQA